jgi:hypothetical protein
MPSPSLDAIRPDRTGEIDDRAKREESYFDRVRESYDIEKLRLESEKRQHELDSLRQDADLRKQFARRIFWLLIAWLLTVLIALIIDGFKIGIADHSFTLPDSVLLALIGSTTANVIGIFLIVVHYLFPEHAMT